MPTIKCVTKKAEKIGKREFCFTDCGPADSCSPDDYDYPIKIKNK